ncbi:hypothetical protein V1508DRAFT_434380 [Lipomyces doorenjongii]|uniref:uncharacterized protein n=1 Tax=Lipomyces doorenjongii TaxID=383834 RepID=UPI0034CE4026
MIHSHDRLIGYGSDYPYLWLKALREDKAFMPTHYRLGRQRYMLLKLTDEVVDPQAVDEFVVSYSVARRLTGSITVRKVGGKDNGGPGIRPEMSRQPYYSAYIYDPVGNNIEAVYVKI